MKKIIATAVIAAAVAVGAAACHSQASGAGIQGPAASPAASPAAPVLTAAEQKFAADAARIPGVSGNTPAKLAALGTQICQSLGGGATASTVESALTGKSWPQAARIVQIAEADVCPQYETRVIASFSGNGIQNTGQFTVSGAGNWVLNWSYDCSSWGMEGNFIVSEDNGNDINGAEVNELGNGSSGQTSVYGDSGTHYLSVDSECSWTLQVVGS